MHYKPPIGYLIRQSVNRYVTLCLITTGLLLLVRLFEMVYVAGKAGYPPGNIYLLLYGIRFDLMLALRFSALLMLPFILVDNFSRLTARVLFVMASVALIMIDLSLLQYFAVTKTPLGADIFNYSVAEIQQAVRSSGQLNLPHILIPAFFTAISLLAYMKWSSREMSRDLTVVIVLLVIFSILPVNSFNPDRIDFRNDFRRYISANKVNVFTSSVVNHCLK